MGEGWEGGAISRDNFNPFSGRDKTQKAPETDQGLFKLYITDYASQSLLITTVPPNFGVNFIRRGGIGFIVWIICYLA